VLCEFQDQTFGVAAKMVYSGRRLWENVDKGARQAAGRAKASLIFADVVNLMPVVDLMREPRKRGFREIGQVLDWALSWAKDWCEAPELRRMAEELGRTAPNPIGVAFFMPMMLLYDGEPKAFFYVHMPLRWVAEGGPDFEFATAFLRACNTVLVSADA
jgi:hypothetical protein